MANYYRDNSDIQFLFRHLDVGKLAEACEDGFKFADEFDYAPADAAEAITGPLEDLKKARWYLDREIQRIEGGVDGA